MAALIRPFLAEHDDYGFRDIPYPEQVSIKDAALRSLFETEDTAWRPFLASPETRPLYYRNKTRFSFVREAGLVRPARHGRQGLEAVADGCGLQSELCDEIVRFAAEFAQSHDWSLYDPATATGWLKHLLVREGKRTGEAMLCLVTDDGPIPGEHEWVAAIRKLFPQVISLYHTVSWGRSNERLEDRLLWGSLYIHETVGPYMFRISPGAFFQTNSAMVETLYAAIAETARPEAGKTVWDLYAGSATIGIYLSGKAGKVISVESNPQNVQDALANLAINQVDNVRVVSATVESGPSEDRPDIIIVDPPRAGLSAAARHIVAASGTRRIVYVSCNPSTCLRDCRELEESGFLLESLQGVDMFPHSSHCEVIACLEKPAA